MKKCLLIQPGAFGDILVCAPIAKWYADRGYDVYYPARNKFHSLLNSLDYLTPIMLNEDILDSDWLRSDVMKIIPSISNYDLVINMADRGPHTTAQLGWEKNQEAKYRLANVPNGEQHNLIWKRNIKKENEIYEKYVKHKDYAFVHNSSSDGEEIKLPSISLPIVRNAMDEGYNIFDWYKIIINAKELYCAESAMHCFCDGIIKQITGKLYLLPRLAGNSELLTVSKYWDKKYFYGN